MPTWGMPSIGIWGLACAVICDECVKREPWKAPEFAVEWTKDLSIIKYHPVKELDDLPEDLQEMLVNMRAVAS